MNEMETLRRLGTELHRPDDPLPESLRRRALQPEWKPVDRHWRAWRIGLAGALAVALAAVAYLSATADKPSRAPEQTQARHAAAVTVLHRAALAAQTSQLSTPAGNQFVFTEMLTKYSSQFVQADGTVTTVPGELTLRRIWLS